jgi:hypothetical protein
MDGTVILGLAGIGATLAAGVVGAGAVLVVARWQRQDADRHRFTDTKRLAYVRLLAALDEMYASIMARRGTAPGSPDVPEDLAFRFVGAVSEVRLVAPEEIRDAMTSAVTANVALSVAVRRPDAEFRAATKEHDAARKRFADAARHDLGVPD